MRNVNSPRPIPALSSSWRELNWMPIAGFATSGYRNLLTISHNPFIFLRPLISVVSEGAKYLICIADYMAHDAVPLTHQGDLQHAQGNLLYSF